MAAMAKLEKGRTLRQDKAGSPLGPKQEGHDGKPGKPGEASHGCVISDLCGGVGGVVRRRGSWDGHSSTCDLSSQMVRGWLIMKRGATRHAPSRS